MQKIIITVAILIVMGIGAYIFMTNNSASTTPADTSPLTTDQNTDQTTPQPVVSNTTETPVTNNVNTTASAITTPTPTVAIIPPVPSPATVVIDIKNFAFNPAILTVKTDTTVTWINNDSAPHTITSDVDNLLDSVTLTPGQSFSFTFTNAGTTNYHCALHPRMKGQIIVQD